jgi:hypothetical protein
MAQFFRSLLLLILLLFLWGRGGDAVATLATVGNDEQTEQQATGYIAAAGHALDFQTAEPNGFAGQINQISFARPSRAQLHYHEFLPQTICRQLTRHTNLSAQLDEHLSSTYPARQTRCACDYYIFTLRRILI